MDTNSMLGVMSMAVIVLNNDLKKLSNRIVMSADISDRALFGMDFGETAFSKKMNEVSKHNDLVNFVISNIENQTEECQNRFVGLVKDREMNGYTLPQNVVIVFPVDSKASIQKISKELYRFCDILF